MKTLNGEEFLTVETRAAWRSFDGRLSLTKRTAARRSARYLIRLKYPCECDPAVPHEGDPGFTCYRHRSAGEEWYAAVEKRLTARIMREGVRR